VTISFSSTTYGVLISFRSARSSSFNFWSKDFVDELIDDRNLVNFFPR